MLTVGLYETTGGTREERGHQLEGRGWLSQGEEMAQEDTVTLGPVLEHGNSFTKQKPALK